MVPIQRYRLIIIYQGLLLVLATVYLGSVNGFQRDFLFPGRAAGMTFMFTHFTPFEDMNNVTTRAQRVGLIPDRLFPDPKNIHIWTNIKADITKIIPAYLDIGIRERKSSNVSKIPQKTLHELLEDVLTASGPFKHFFLQHLCDLNKPGAVAATVMEHLNSVLKTIAEDSGITGDAIAGADKDGPENTDDVQTKVGVDGSEIQPGSTNDAQIEVGVGGNGTELGNTDDLQTGVGVHRSGSSANGSVGLFDDDVDEQARSGNSTSDQALVYSYHRTDGHKKFNDAFYNEPLVEINRFSKIEPLFVYGMRAWKIYYLLAMASNPKLFTVLKTTPGWPPENHAPPALFHDAWSLLFIRQYCNLVQTNASYGEIKIPAGFCPDPCRSLPCENMPHTASNNCTAIGFATHEFRCTCQPGYSWMKLDDWKGHCGAADNCAAFCDPRGTRRCDVIAKKTFCVCRPRYMGPTCSKMRDPCLELSSPMEIPGNTLCNVAEGNKCIGEMGTNNFRCSCSNSHTSDPTYALPNCMGFKDRCLSMICLQGDCISSKDGQEAYCICPAEAYGKHCELYRGKWAQWAPWSECTPNCGISEYQRRVRTRDCLGEACRGGEGHLQMEMCDTIPCPDETLILARQGRMEEMNELKVQLLQADAARYVKFVGALVNALLLIACLFTILTVTAMAVSVHLM